MPEKINAIKFINLGHSRFAFFQNKENTNGCFKTLFKDFDLLVIIVNNKIKTKVKMTNILSA